MSKRGFEMYQYRQALARMRQVNSYGSNIHVGLSSSFD